ncbi:MAG TPA: glycosyltransferase family 2 protein [Bryobacteraceae bacterium]|nr:glycosyltransferase family 2 protein [Bryobacteraceae bacterium]
MLTGTLLGTAVGFVLWVIAGYPLALSWLARRRALPTVKRLDHRTVSILLPVHDGEAWIGPKLESILNLSYPRKLVQTIVICDGCTDRTEQIARRYARFGLEVIALPHGGKAVALNEGLRRATGEILFFTDVRQQLDRDCLANLVACFADSRVGAVSGELVICDGATHEEANTGLYWKYEKWLRKRQSRLDSVLGATGAVWAIRAALARPLAPETILDDVNQPLNAFFAGYRVLIEESALAYDYPTSLETEFRRKVRTQAGVYQTIREFPELLSQTRNRMWLHFMSHKLGRLLLPWALLSILLLSFALPPVWRALFVASQALFYGLAAADMVIPERSRLKRLSSPVRTFVVLMAAAAMAVSILFVSHKTLWKETRVTIEKARAA